MREPLLEPTRYANIGFFVANRTNNLQFPPSTLVNLAFDTALTNDLGAYDFGQQKYVCPKAGRLFVSLAYSVASQGNTELYLITSCTNTSLKNSAMTFATSLVTNARFSYSNCFFLDVNLGTTIGLSFYSTSANVSTNLLAEDCCFINGYYLT